jgi:hypothetical protein
MSRTRKPKTTFREGNINMIDNAELRRRLKENDRNPLMPGEIAVLHVWTPGEFERSRAPIAFRGSRMWGHLFGDDADELVRLAKIFGVRRPFVHRQGKRGQHVDLCGRPLGLMMQGITEAGEKKS